MLCFITSKSLKLFGFSGSLITVKSFWIRLSGLSGLLAVALGALGAHKLYPTLSAHGVVNIWEKAAHYHLVHSAVLLALALWGGAHRMTSALFIGGILFFSGSLYIYALTLRTPLMYLTPIGGILLLVAWGSLIFIKKT